MFRQPFSCGAMLSLALAAILWTPAVGWAQRLGGVRTGGAPINSQSYYHYYPAYGYHYYYFPYYVYPPNPYGFYPFNTYSSGNSYLEPETTPDEPPPSVDRRNTPSTPIDTTAHVTVSVPAGAEIWFDGTKMSLTGRVREFQSPPLPPGQRYSYEVRALWTENSHEIKQTQKVSVSAGATVRVQFPIAPETKEAGPGAKER